MPITVSVANHPATAWKKGNETSSAKLLHAACRTEWHRTKRIQQSSFSSSPLSEQYVSGSENGFVWAAFHAYSSHHHLVIRPEDVWFAILTQLSFYINAHAEELRSFFVDHEGKKELKAVSCIRDFGALAIQMTDLTAKEVKDPEWEYWVMPSFSTTTYHDRVVAAVLFMGVMQAYFIYHMAITCGIPSVTLLGESQVLLPILAYLTALGEVDDWQNILERLHKTDQLGKEPKHFANMLRPILRNMVLTFQQPSSSGVTSFWNKIVHHNDMGGGDEFLSGWLTAFCFWSDKGKPHSLDCWSSVTNTLFDGVQYPFVDIASIPRGYPATMIAGSVGIKTWRSSNNSLSEGERDTVQPVSGWWICENESPKNLGEKATAICTEKTTKVNDEKTNEINEVEEEIMLWHMRYALAEDWQTRAFYQPEEYSKLMKWRGQLAELQAA